MAIDLFSVTVLSIPRVLLVAAAVCAQWGYRISTGFGFYVFFVLVFYVPICIQCSALKDYIF